MVNTILDTLRSIVQEVNAAPDLEQALSIIVKRVKLAVNTDVCSVYMVETATRDLVLMASDGLLSEAIGVVRLNANQGLVGLVTQRAEPLNIDNAHNHPNYCYFTETGEVSYHAFLGVPIIHHRQVLGVVVIRQQTVGKYDENTVSFLITIAAQLAAAIVHAQSSGGMTKLGLRGAVGEVLIKGTPGAPGVAIGQAVVVHSLTDINSIPDRIIDNIAAERARFLAAVEAVKHQVRQMITQMATVITSADSFLFDAYLMILDDASFIGPIVASIEAGNWAPGALRESVNAHIRVFDTMEDHYLRERAADMRDLGRRILAQLQQTPNSDIAQTRYPAKTILVGEEISATMLAEVPKQQLIGVVSVRGSRTSHTAILARALGIPAVMGAVDLPLVRMHELKIIIDGYSGNVYINPSQEISKEYLRLQKEERALSADLQGMRELESITVDGVHIPLYANTGLLSDIQPSLNCGAEGVGLYRTEFPFLIRERFPGEEEQYKVYRHVLEAFAPRPVTLRTLDVGGDKALPYFPIEEDNPFLGWRGIRITLDHPEIFQVQIRAMLRANLTLNNLRILLPMIATLSEVDESINLIRRIHQEMQAEYPAIPLPPIGVMVEVPSVVYQIDTIATRVDFLSIGSNDLTQYLLAVDRNNARVAHLYDALHPAVIHAIALVAQSAKKHRIPISVCGEMAGDPIAAIILLGLGINSLSMSAGNLPRIKWVIRSFSRRRARALTQKALAMDDPQSIRAHLNRVLEKAGLGGLVHAGK